MSLRNLTTILLSVIALTMTAADFTSIKSGAEAGRKEDMYILGMLYLQGTDDVPRDTRNAMSWLKRSADKGYAPAILRVGIGYIDGISGETNHEKAWQMINHAYDKGCINALYYIAQMHNHGWYVPENTTRYMEALKQAVALNDADALTEMGILKLYGDRRTLIKQDAAAGVAMLQKAAQEGNARAMLYMGYAYGDGMGGLRADDAAAYNMFTLSARNGNIQAVVECAKCLTYGYGMEPDYATASEMLTYAAQQGNGEASYVFGDIYRHGKGVEANDSIAATYYRTACENGYDHAAPVLAWMYMQGAGVPADSRKAYDLFSRAAKANIGAGYTGMGVCHEYAKGAHYDLNKALAYYRQGASSGDMGAYYRLYDIYRNGKYNTEKDPAKAMEYLNKGVAGNDCNALYALGVEHLIGEILDKDTDKGMQLIVKAADLGSTDASAWLGNNYYSGTNNLDKDFDKAFMYLSNVDLHPGVLEDETLAKVYRNLSACYRFGRGTATNEERAEYYTLKSRALGDAEMGDVIHFQQYYGQ